MYKENKRGKISGKNQWILLFIHQWQFKNELRHIESKYLFNDRNSFVNLEPGALEYCWPDQTWPFITCWLRVFAELPSLHRQQQPWYPPRCFLPGWPTFKHCILQARTNRRNLIQLEVPNFVRNKSFLVPDIYSLPLSRPQPALLIAITEFWAVDRLTVVLHWSGDKAWLSGQVWPKPGQIIIWSGQIWSGRPYNLSGLAGYGQARPKKLSGQVICGLVRPNNYLVWSDLVSA